MKILNLAGLMPLRVSFLDRFFFFRGGAYNAAIARMLLAISLWLSIKEAGDAYLWNFYVESYKSWGWVPKGLAKIFVAPPNQDFVINLFHLSQFFCITMFLGVFTRTSAVIAAVSATLYASLIASFGPYWSHGFNVQLLAALSFMFGRSGDVLSVDAVVRRFRALPSPLKKHDGEYWWPVLFAELSTHMFMFGAFYQKFTLGNGVWWAWSDNLRNSLAVSWGLARFNPPELVLWVANNPWLYKTAGTLQLIAQFSTIFCLFLVRHPVLRLVIGGMFFFLEIVGLTRLFEFWHPFWVPLCLLSVDWEWLYGKITGKIGRPVSTQRGYLVMGAFLMAVQKRALDVVDNIGSRYRLAVYAFMALFFGYYAANIIWKLGEKHLNYPFSSMAFFSENRALAPYSKPNYFPIYRGWIEVETVDGKKLEPSMIPSPVVNPILISSRDASAQQQLHVSGKLLLKNAFWMNSPQLSSSSEIGSYRTYSQIVAVPPRPRPALPMVVLHSGLTSISDKLGFRGVTPSLTWDEASKQYFITVEAFGFRDPSFKILARKNVREEPQEVDPKELAGAWRGNRFFIKHTGDGAFLYTLIEVADKALGVTETYAGPENFQSYR
ncbi:hypothetical protein D3870_03875 [Noviherbaspirillum cavernae]|uniref:HTTM domain-containing protein n=1 Tax=Noviherbaspirillum cavernae TaxID=2320862 RepID=A0A418WYF2_9BURK|nr:hypothetical protein [Noviherbaspirillum cavernae]RJG05270.1 hypothetical protein D3870_03875 [Noviherbaspirillum cavernae]